METIGIIGYILGYKLGLYWGCIGIMEKKMETPNNGEPNGKNKWIMTWKLLFSV